MASNSSVDTAAQVEPSPSPALPEKEGMSRRRIVVADYGKGTAHPLCPYVYWGMHKQAPI